MDQSAEERIYALIDDCLDGDMDAFGEMYDLTITHVKRNVLFLLETKQDADDIIHDVYLEVYKSLKNYKRSGTFSSWLTGIAIRKIQHHRRKGWKIGRLLEKSKAFASSTIEPDFSKMLVEQLDQRELVVQIQALPFKYRSILLLKYLHGYSQDEIAEVLQLPVGTVKSRLHHALIKARTQFNRLEREP